MIDFRLLPSSEAQQLNEFPIMNNEFEFTYIESIDEQKLYIDLNSRLILLERSLDMDKTELDAIDQLAEGFLAAIDEKEEVLLRIDWLRRLYKFNYEIKSIDSKEKAMRLRRLILSVQTCPMKKMLMDEIDSLEQSLPKNSIEPSKEQILMEKAIEEIGTDFINLGKAGREYVLADVISQYADNADVENMKELTTAIENRVNDLKEINELSKMITHLDQLPLQSFSILEANRKEAIAKRLIETKKWSGLATLDRIISQHNRAITAELKKKQEMEHTILTPDGKFAFTLTIENDSHEMIKVDN